MGVIVLLLYNFKFEFHTKKLVPRGEGSGKNYTLKLSTKYTNTCMVKIDLKLDIKLEKSALDILF